MTRWLLVLLTAVAFSGCADDEGGAASASSGTGGASTTATSGNTGGSGGWGAASCSTLADCCSQLPDDQQAGCEYDSATGLPEVCGPRLNDLVAMGYCIN